MIKDLFEMNLDMFKGYGHDNSIVFKAATTCYRSEEHTQKTPEQFVNMLKNNKHLAMLEFSYYSFAIEFNIFAFPDYYNEIKKVKEMFEKFKYFETTVVNSIQSQIMIVSGNGRAWLDFLSSLSVVTVYQHYIMSVILSKLKKANPKMFDDVFLYEISACEMTRSEQNIFLVTSFDDNDELISYYFSKKLGVAGFDHLKKHIWFAFKASGVSRGLTHELVRHRTFSFAQASSRYIDNSNFDFKFDLEGFKEEFFKNNQTESYDAAYDTLVHFEAICKAMYQKLRVEYKIRNDIIRQVLPIGISNEICFAANLKDLEHFFTLRLAKVAHPEIRHMAQMVEKGVDTYLETKNMFRKIPVK